MKLIKTLLLLNKGGERKIESILIEKDGKGWDGKGRKLPPFSHTSNKGVQRLQEVQQ